MADLVTAGAIVAGTLSFAAEALGKGILEETAKSLYKKLTTLLAPRAVGDVAALEKNPTSPGRRAVLAELVDALPPSEQISAQDLAHALAGELAKSSSQAEAVGLDIGRLTALEAALGNITVTQGTGVHIGEADVRGTLRTGDISVGPPPGKS